MDSAIIARDEQAFQPAQRSGTEESAVQNPGSLAFRRLKFLALWAAVALPMIWGITKTWEDVQNLF
jgi:hypothetical protein